MRIIQITLAVALAMVGLSHPLRAAAGAVSVRAILITATDQKAPADQRLAPYEAELQRLLPFSSFRYVGEGTAAVSGSSTKLTLARGHSLNLEGDKAGGRIRLKVQWKSGNDELLTTSLSLNPGVPSVLVHRGPSDATPVVIVIAK